MSDEYCVKGSSIRSKFEFVHDRFGEAAERALKEWMPCSDCCMRPCPFSHDRRNKGRVEGKDCLRVTDEEN